jgi:hypothetical protein
MRAISARRLGATSMTAPLNAYSVVFWMRAPSAEIACRRAARDERRFWL